MKTIITTFLILITFAINAQNFQGKAIYKTSSKTNFKLKDNKHGNDKLEAQIRKRLEKMNQKTFILKFDAQTSTYKEEVKLASPDQQVGKNKVMVMSFGGSENNNVYFKNIKENRFSNQTEIMGKRFLVKDKLPVHKWQLLSETKNIGKYTCYKATFSKEVEKVHFIIKDGKNVEEKKKEIITTTAWYTTQISTSNGPKNYQGLPGLILEINDGTKTIVCTEIVLNPSEKITILEPKKGKIVSKEKFDKIKEEKNKELLEKFKSRKGVDMGNGMTIKMGG